MPVPTNVTELQPFLGMCQYLAKYSARTAELSQPLRQLTCTDTPFTWGPEHDEALKALEKEISAAPTLRYYDPCQPLVLQTDAFNKGLGAVLLQNSQPVYFASKALHGSQKNYVAIELEALAVSWAIEKFHHYLYGHTFTLETDRKPLVSILGRSLLEASKTMLLMKTVPYHFDVKYIKGSTNVIADCLSRAPITTDSIHLPILQINLVTQSLRCTHKIKMQWLWDLTSQDDNLTLLGEVVKQGWPQMIQDLPPELKPFWTFREVITIADGLLLKGDRIIVPERARKEILEQIHHGHLGIQKCLQWAKATVYWPGLYDELKTLISSCTVCCTVLYWITCSS